MLARNSNRLIQCLAPMAVGALLLAGCAVGMQSVETDKQMGQEVAKEIEAGLGIVPDSTTTAYVSAVGSRLEQVNPDRTFDFSFYVVDQDVPNAFAAPGGWVYFTRGILVLTNTEDELATVIGHEMTHVTRRHVARQLAKARTPKLLTLPGRIVGGVLSENLGNLINAPADILGTAYLAKNSRQDEFEADRGGQDLAAAADYDPQGLAPILERLERYAELETGEKRIPSFFDSHPSTPRRSEEINAYAQKLEWTRRAGVVDSADDHLRKLDGLIVGENPAGGVLEGRKFIHPALYFSMKFPEGWKTVNLRQAGVSVSPQQDALMVLGVLGRGTDPSQAADQLTQAIYKKHRVGPARSESLRIRQIPAHLVAYTDDSGREPMHLAFLYVGYRGLLYQLIAIAPESRRGVIRDSALSFRPLTKSELNTIKETRLRVVEARAGETLTQLSKRTGNVWDVRMTAVVNGIAADQKLKGGQLVKIAVPQAYSGPVALAF